MKVNERSPWKWKKSMEECINAVSTRTVCNKLVQPARLHHYQGQQSPLMLQAWQTLECKGVSNVHTRAVSTLTATEQKAGLTAPTHDNDQWATSTCCWLMCICPSTAEQGCQRILLVVALPCGSIHERLLEVFIHAPQCIEALWMRLDVGHGPVLVAHLLPHQRLWNTRIGSLQNDEVMLVGIV